MSQKKNWVYVENATIERSLIGSIHFIESSYDISWAIIIKDRWGGYLSQIRVPTVTDILPRMNS